MPFSQSRPPPFLASFMGLSLLLAGCVTPPENRQRPPVLENALEFSRAAEAAFGRDEYEEATSLYFQALTLHQSVDNAEGILRNLLNIAVVKDEAGQNQAALESLDAMDRYVTLLQESASPDISSPSINRLRAEGFLLRSRLSSSVGNTDLALADVAQALSLVPASDKALRGRCLSREARLLENMGRYEEAWAKVNEAQPLLAKADELAQADNHRIMGRLALKTNHPSVAESAFTAALTLDQKWAQPHRVADDLLGLAETCLVTGHPQRAQAFALRSLGSAQSAGDTERIARANAFLNSTTFSQE
jgi:tetratricopeptide (TPR) repeat protein